MLTSQSPVASQPLEDAITINLVHLLSKDLQARRLFHWLEFQFEPFGFTTDGTAYSKGRIDMALLVDRDHERYLAYECKRLNVVREGGRSSLATPYVREGVARFVTEQYAEGLPVGCMLGYVMDGDVAAAQTKVQGAIDRHRSDIGLTAEPEPAPSIGEARRFLSRHLRAASGWEIEVRHALLPFNRGTSPRRPTTPCASMPELLHGKSGAAFPRTTCEDAGGRSRGKESRRQWP